MGMVHWQLFGSLTFKSWKLSDRVRETMFLAFVREIGNASRVDFHRLLWVRRRERGEVAGRLHLHCLLGGLPSKRVHVGMCFQAMRLWERVGGGNARVRLFDSDTETPDGALAYSVKDIGADVYEGAKFGSKAVIALQLSDSCYRVARSVLAGATRNSVARGEGRLDHPTESDYKAGSITRAAVSAQAKQNVGVRVEQTILTT